MVAKLLEAQDIAGGTFLLLFAAMAGATVLLLAGTAWVPRRWKLPVALSGVTALISAIQYLLTGNAWLASGQMTVIHRYVGWFLTTPLQVLTLFFFVRAVAHVRVGVFWRLLVAAVIMVLARYMGEAGWMHPTLGLLIALAAWLYVLGEAFFGQMSERIAKSDSEAVRRGYFWMRLIATVGWAIYPLCYFITALTTSVGPADLIVTYNLADLVNQIAFGLIVLTVGVKEGGS